MPAKKHNNCIQCCTSLNDALNMAWHQKQTTITETTVLTTASLLTGPVFLGGTTGALWEKQQMFTNHLHKMDVKRRCDADMQLTAANGNNIVVVVVVIYLDDLRRQLAAAAFILRAALTINQTVPLVRLLHKFLTLLYGPDGERGSHIK